MDNWQAIDFTIQMTGYFFYVIVKPYDLIDKALDSSRDRSLIPRVVTYDLAKPSNWTRDHYVVTLLHFTKQPNNNKYIFYRIDLINKRLPFCYL